MKLVPDWAGELIAASVVGVFGYLFKTTRRVELIEQVQLDRDKQQLVRDVQMTELQSKVNAHGETLARVDTLVAEVKLIIPDFKAVGDLVHKLDGVLESSNRRLELMENVLLGRRS